MSEEKNPSPELAFAIKTTAGDFRARGNVPFRWVGTHWEEVEIADLEKEALHFIARTSPAKATDRSAASAARTAILYAEQLVSANQTLIPTLTGYVKIEPTGVSHIPAAKEFGITYMLNCGFDPFTKCQMFDAFLSEALPNNDVKNYLQEYAGYTLLPDARHQLAAWLVGDGGTGKGTFAEIMQALHRKTVALSIDSLDGFKLAGLQTASLVCVDETPARIDEQRLKTLVSGDVIQIDRKYRDPITIRSTAKWFVNANILPSITDHSDGFWRRWLVFPFNIKPREKKLLLAEAIIAAELSGVLNWAVAGLQRLLARGSFPVLPEEMRDAQKSAKQQSNSVAEWVEDDGITYGESVKNTRADVYDRYSFWCGRSGSKAVGSPKFWERLRQIFPGIPEDRNAAREPVGGKGGKRKAMVHIEIPIPN